MLPCGQHVVLIRLSGWSRVPASGDHHPSFSKSGSLKDLIAITLNVSMVTPQCMRDVTSHPDYRRMLKSTTRRWPE